MNILSFDIEEWYLEKILHNGRPERYRQFDEMLERVLQDLDARNIKATFFCIGKMATDFPDVVRKIAVRGHDIGCHSGIHRFLTAFTREELLNDTRDAVHALEDLTGERVRCYRAPAFSITPENAWAVEVLAECGIESDASIFPAARDYGGYPGFPMDTPCRISCRGTVLKEYPVPILTLAGKRLAFSGGGYFRALPFGLIRREMARRDYNIGYFHLGELIPEPRKMLSKAQHEAYYREPGTLKNRLVRFAKSNIGSGDSYGKLVRMMDDFPFGPVSRADALLDWDKLPVIPLSDEKNKQ